VISLNNKGLDPSNFLVENIDLLPGGNALDVAMGNGRNAIFLAERGFHVFGIDISKEAITEALELAAVSNVKLTAHVADLTTGSHIQPGIYDVIICFNYLQRSLIPEIKSGLRSGGVIVYETFIVDQARYGKPKNPNHLLKHNELLRMFRDFRCIRYHEGILEDKKAVAGIIAEKGV
jgi:2-polyprenyl-3-methyl-5-hydroxy-6-metoxy-1,4-benzoquinol methylase